MPKWEIDFPNSPLKYTPFLDTEIRIDDEGILHHRYYRKSQKKNITLNFQSHHQMSTKIEVVKNFYKTADICSSHPEYVVTSFQKIDHLLRCNNYSNPRSMINIPTPKCPKIKLSPSSRVVNLKLPYISETFSYSIRRFVAKQDLPIRIIFTPGTKLQDFFCTSRPYDKRKCCITNCTYYMSQA